MIKNLGVIGFYFLAMALAAVGVAQTNTAPAPAAQPVPSDENAVAMTDPSVFLSPYCWRIDANGSAICPAAGGYMKFNVTGTSEISIRVNTAINKGLAAVQMPSVKIVANEPGRDGLAQYVQFPANESEDTLLSLVTGLNPKLVYNVVIQAVGGDETQTSGWSGTIFQTQINHLVFDPGATLSPAPLRTKRALFLGASYEQAYFGAAKPDQPVYTYVDASLSWPFFVAYGLDCEYGQVGIGSQGWINPGNGGYPAFPTSWDHFDQANAKTFRNDLDYVFVHMAENDNAKSDSEVKKAVAAWISAARSVLGDTTKIFFVLSLPQIKSAPIKAGVRAAKDPLTFVIDPGEEFKHTVFSGGPTWAAPGDGLHLDAIHQGLFTAFVTKQAQADIDGAK